MSLRKILARVRRADEGFSMVVTMGAVVMLSLSMAVAVDTVTKDQGVGRKDRDRKAGYAAAEAGLQVYVHKLLDDNTYWAKCAVPADGLNQPWLNKPDPKVNPNPTDPRTWKYLPDNSAMYTIESLPVTGKTKCDVADPEGSMIAPGTPTFRIRVTGQSVANGKRIGPKRSLIATFKRKSFLDYIYFTDLEVLDPTTYPQSLAQGDETREQAGQNPDTLNPLVQRDIAGWGNVACSKYAYQKAIANRTDGLQYRADQRFKGVPPTGGKRDMGSTGAFDSWSAACSEINFISADWIQGPMHTNDTPMLCGSPKFGRNPTDVIEISGPGDTSVTDVKKSWRNSTTSGCGTSSPDVNFEGDTSPDADRGTWKFNQKLLKLPSSNTSLKNEASADYSFVGRTTIVLANNGIRITGTRANGTTLNNQTVSYPPEGVIYVDNGDTCTETYKTSAPNAVRAGCGIAVVQGTYNNSLTIGAADDILITDDINRDPASPVVLGLVSQNFIRLNHPMLNQASQDSCAQGKGGTNGVGAQTNPNIDAALLALKHSFIVDNWQCGAQLGTLTINGAIAQKYRGPVGTGSGKVTGTGYVKLYKYDDRLRVRIPPKFIDPVESAWGIQTYQEQAPPQ